MWVAWQQAIFRASELTYDGTIGRNKEARDRDCSKDKLMKVTFAQMPSMCFGHLESLHLGKRTSLVSINFIGRLKFVKVN